jgi:cation diffusion facilitator CzcD-associated flavoprotein CzcO
MATQSDIADYDVVIIGAGISGINCAYRLQERNPELSYIILEGRHEIGGTWSLFKYPGLRSDSDLYTFGFPWRNWTSTSSIAQGSLIIDYVKESAEMYGIDKKILFNHKVDAANWSSDDKSWKLNVTADGSTQKTIRGRWLQLCTGYYDYEAPLQAVIPGIEDFKGEVVHPQFWSKDLDYKNKNVVIIGSGATAVTLLPVLAKETSHVTMLQRSPSYLMSQPTEDGMEKFFRAWLPAALAYRLIRFKWILVPFLLTTFFKYFPNTAKKIVKGAAAKQLPANLAIDPHFNPKYNVFQQRLCFCPDGDFYACLRDGTGSVATGTIEKVSENTIKLQSGEELHPDIIVTATGLKLQVAGGMNLTVDGSPYDVSEKYFWKGVMLEDLPNAAMTIGYVDASWTLGADATAQMVCRILKRMRKEGVAEVVPRCSEKQKSIMKEKPVLNLTSTYIKAAGTSVLPKAGDRGQWAPRSYYYEDILMAWFGDIKSNMEWIKAI